jgi:hypothetical protein
MNIRDKVREIVRSIHLGSKHEGEMKADIEKRYNIKCLTLDQATDQILELLPSEEEISKSVSKYFIFKRKFSWFGKERFGRKVILNIDDSDRIAKAIHELIRANTS